MVSPIPHPPLQQTHSVFTVYCSCFIVRQDLLSGSDTCRVHLLTYFLLVQCFCISRVRATFILCSIPSLWVAPTFLTTCCTSVFCGQLPWLTNWLMLHPPWPTWPRNACLPACMPRLEFPRGRILDPTESSESSLVR